jgi:hypothetical protein
MIRRLRVSSFLNWSVLRRVLIGNLPFTPDPVHLTQFERLQS